MNVEHDRATERFLIRLDDGLAYLKYRMRGDDIIDMQTTWVPPSARGGGVASALVEAAMEFARSEKRKVVPSCWYVDVWIERHPAYEELRAA